MTHAEFLASIAGDIDPAMYAGEGFYNTEEYARPDDITDPFTRAQVGREEDYYPAPRDKPWMRGY